MTSTQKALAFATLAVCIAAGGTYYLIKQDQRVKGRKQARAAEKAAMQLLHQVSNDRQALLESHLDSAVVVPEHQQEYTLAYCNEMLLRLLERLDAIQPYAAIMEDCGGDSPTAFEESLIDNVKRRKRKLIQRINQDFERIDQIRQKHNERQTAYELKEEQD